MHVKVLLLAIKIFKSIHSIVLGNIGVTCMSPNGNDNLQINTFIAGLGNVDGTLGRPNCVKHPGWTFTMTMSSQNINLRIFC